MTFRKSISAAAAAMVFLMSAGAAMAQCEVKIRTAEAQLSWLADQNRAAQDRPQIGGERWKVNVQEARGLIKEAKEALGSGEAWTCDMLATAALKRLGNGNI